MDTLFLVRDQLQHGSFIHLDAVGRKQFQSLSNVSIIVGVAWPVAKDSNIGGGKGSFLVSGSPGRKRLEERNGSEVEGGIGQAWITKNSLREVRALVAITERTSVASSTFC